VGTSRPWAPTADGDDQVCVRVFGTAEMLFGLRRCLFAEMDLRLGWGFLLLCFRFAQILAMHWLFYDAHRYWFVP
jgi:hypothetical protein